jgi:hypothetical protein
LVKAVIPCARKGQMLFCGKKNHSDSTKKFSETDIINMLEFLIDSIIVIFVGRVFQQTVGIPMGTNCEEKRKEVRTILNFTFRYIDDVLSLNNSRFGDFVDRIYPNELEIKDTTDTDRSASYLDLHLEIDSEGRLRTKLYNKKDDFNFHIVNFPFISINIPAAPAYGIYISQLIRYLEFVIPIRISLIDGCC